MNTALVLKLIDERMLDLNNIEYHHSVDSDDYEYGWVHGAQNELLQLRNVLEEISK